MNNKKKIITIILILLVILLGGASIYVATQLSTRRSVAPTAPESKPKASEDEVVWIGSEACTVTGVATAIDVPRTCTDGPAMSDNFTGTVIDTNKWKIDGESGYELKQANDSLIVAMSSSSGRSGASLISKLIDGDFDTQVEIKEATITAPEGSYGSIDLIAWQDGSSIRFDVRLIKENGGGLFAEYYFVNGGNDFGTSTKISMPSSTTKLYMERRGQAMEAFVIKGGEKISLGTKTMSFTGPVEIFVGSWKTLPAVTSAVLDNFVISCSCTPTTVITCNPDCPTTCGKAASTIDTCTNSCGTATTKACPATEACAGNGGWSEWTACTATTCGTSGTKTHNCNNPVPSGSGLECLKVDGVTRTTPTARTETVACSAAECVKVELEGSKTAYKNVTSNTPGVYTLSSLMEFVSKSQIYVYTIELKNISETTASGVVVKDSLANMPVTFMDTVAGCRYSATDLELTCNTSIEPDATKKLSFRVKASDGVANGTVISNTGNVTYSDGSLEVTKDLTASSIVGCNHTCTTDEECSSGLTCDTTTSKCRTAACLTEDDCYCPSIVVPTVTRASGGATAAPTRVAATTGEVTQTGGVIAKTTPTILPETGIFDLPGIAAFGGGLFLAIIGILLAL